MTTHEWVQVVAACACLEFVLWYVDRDGSPIEVCRCGHPKSEHVDEHQCSGRVLKEI